MTEINQPAIFLIVEVSKKWYDALPKDLQEIIDRDAAAESVAINPFAAELHAKARKSWVDKGGELISLPPDEQAAMMKHAGERRRGRGEEQAGAERRPIRL